MAEKPTRRWRRWFQFKLSTWLAQRLVMGIISAISSAFILLSFTVVSADATIPIALTSLVFGLVGGTLAALFVERNKSWQSVFRFKLKQILICLFWMSVAGYWHHDWNSRFGTDKVQLLDVVAGSCALGAAMGALFNHARLGFAFGVAVIWTYFLIGAFFL